MRSQDKNSSDIAKGESVVKVSTADLRSRLNHLYSALRNSGRSESLRFDYLWDLKELALMEGRQNVDVPETWLDELERGICDRSQHGQIGH